MLATISILALIAVIIVSCISERVNIGILATSVALLLSRTLTTMSVKQVIGFFPSELFFMIISVSLLFGIAAENGTLQWLTARMLKLVNGSTRWYPILFYLLTFSLSALGPGNIAATAIIAPIAMRMAHQHKLNPFLMAILVCTGANAGAFSPVAPTGVITTGLLKQIGITGSGMGFTIFLAAAVLQSLTAIGALLFLRSQKSDPTLQTTTTVPTLTKRQYLTLIIIMIVIGSVLFFKVPLVIAALIGSCVLGFCGASEESIIKKLPWDIVLMISGISILIGLVEKFGGLDLATTLLARFGISGTIHATLAFLTGLVSAYSSSSGVVLPAFMPLIPGLLEKVQQGSASSLAIAIAVGSHMVDVSPLSTLGALTIASYPDQSERGLLFRKLMTWGVSMSVVGAILAFLVLDVAKLWQ